MDREKRNPRLDGVSALLVVSFPCEAPSSVTCVGLCCLLRTSKSSIRFFVRLRMEFLKLAEVSLRLLLQHPSLARTRHCRSGFGFRSHDRHRHCRSDIDLDVAMGVAFFFPPEQLDARNRVPLIQYVVVSFDAYMCNLRPSPQYGKCCSGLPRAY
jgi:hypothetical protein